MSGLFVCCTLGMAYVMKGRGLRQGQELAAKLAAKLSSSRLAQVGAAICSIRNHDSSMQPAVPP